MSPARFQPLLSHHLWGAIPGKVEDSSYFLQSLDIILIFALVCLAVKWEYPQLRHKAPGRLK